jgi:hypothetical protein
MPQPGLRYYFRGFFFRLSISFSESRQTIPKARKTSPTITTLTSICC